MFGFLFFSGQRLEESLEYQQFVANVEEEEAWINEKLNLVGSEDYGDTLAAVQVQKNKPRLVDYAFDLGHTFIFLLLACVLIFIHLALIFQGLLKKHEAFETDFTVHRDRVNDVCTNGDELVKKVQFNF